MSRLRVGADTGGTFTDVVLVDGDGTVTYTKTTSTPADQSIGVVAGVEKVCALANHAAADVSTLIHGTTVAVNALLEHGGARIAVMLTAGFGDLLFIRRQQRPDLYNWFATKPSALTSRELCFEVPERILHSGSVELALDEAAAEEAARAVLGAGVDAVAICLLHSYVNPHHERLLAAAFEALDSSLLVSLSSDISPEAREYERCVTTAANAYVRPQVKGYLHHLKERLGDLGIGELAIMASSGGLMAGETAEVLPVRTMLSGPAAGVVGSIKLARDAGFHNIITIDMGGTSFDVSLATGAEPAQSKDGEIGGIPLRVPMVDMHTLGAGGGSIAWLDDGGALKVGPKSAGAVPGPACYGLGGTSPTVTDANVALGRLDPADFAAGEIEISRAAAEEAIEQHIAGPLGLSLEAAAMGILRVVNAAMVRGMRLISVERGYDPRDFSLFAFGGGGPLHATELAAEFGATQVIIPRAPGVTSAIGLLLADFKYDASATFREALTPGAVERLEQAYLRLETDVTRRMQNAGVDMADCVFVRLAGVRYERQGHELVVFVPDQLTADSERQIADRFHGIHEQTFGYRSRQQGLFVVDIQVNGISRRADPRLRFPAATPVGGRRSEVTRKVYFADGWQEVRVVERSELASGDEVDGPAVIQQPDTTCLLGSQDHARVDDQGNIVIQIGAGSHG